MLVRSGVLQFVLTHSPVGLPLKLTFFLLPTDLVHQTDLFTSTGTGEKWFSIIVCTRMQSQAQDVVDSIGVSADVLVERSAQLYRLSVDANLFE